MALCCYAGPPLLHISLHDAKLTSISTNVTIHCVCLFPPPPLPLSQHVCGYEYTSKLQHMVLDIRLSADTLSDFNKHVVAMGSPLPIRFSVMILKSAAWPLQPSNCSPMLPPQLRTAKKKVRNRCKPAAHNAGVCITYYMLQTVNWGGGGGGGLIHSGLLI